MNNIQCESFLESIYAEILAICETNFDDSTDSGNFCMCVCACVCVCVCVCACVCVRGCYLIIFFF